VACGVTHGALPEVVVWQHWQWLADGGGQGCAVLCSAGKMSGAACDGGKAHGQWLSHCCPSLGRTLTYGVYAAQQTWKVFVLMQALFTMLLGCVAARCGQGMRC
jgi:hypothetical protein